MERGTRGGEGEKERKANRRRGPLAGTHLRDSRMDDEMYTDWQAGENAE